MTYKHYTFKIVIVIFCLFCIFTMSGCKNKKDNGLELISFKLKDVSTTRKLAFYETSSDSYDSYLEPYNNIINIEAIVKNNNRDSFIDMVLYISFLDTYVVYNEGNGEYTCSTTTVYENDLWVTKINLEVQLYKCSDLYGELSVSEINFLHNGSFNEQVDLNKTGKKNITFHKHLYNQEKIQVEYLASDADHYNKTKYYYSCECGKCGYDTFSTGLPIEHTYDQQVISPEYLIEYANCNHGDLYYYSCLCGHKSNEYFEVGEGKHTFAPYDNFEYNIYNEDETLTDCGTMTRKCTSCSYQYIEKVDGTGGSPILIYKDIDKNTCAVVGITTKSPKKKIIVPEYYQGKKVISISSGVFQNMEQIESITLPFVGNTLNGTTNTHFEYIFGGSVPTSLKEVIITGGTSIGYCAFIYCSSLESIVIPNSVTSIGDCAFYECSSLTSIEIPNSVTSIGDCAFFNCSITSIEIPNSVTRLGAGAFYLCNSLTSITIPNSVTSIGRNAFNGCSSLESITLPFVGNTLNGTTNTHFGYIFGATSRSDNNSHVPSSLKEVIITGGTSISNYAFYECSSLTSIEIPNSVTSIGSSAFYDCNGLENVYYNGKVEDWCNILFSGSDSNPMYYAKHFFMLDSNNEYYEVTEIEIPNSVTSIGDCVFSGCSSLTNVVIPNSVTSIGDGAFYECSSLTNVVIPNSVKSIGFGPFSGCSSLENVYYNGTIEDWCNISFRSSDSNPMYYAKHFFMLDSNNEYYEATEIEIPNSVTSIGSYAFLGCSSLTNVVIPNSVTSIGSSAFYDCNGLENVYYNGKVEDWCNILFSGPDSNPMYYTKHFFILDSNNEYYEVTEIEIPNSVKSIGSWAFFGCSSLTNVVIPNSVKSIGVGAFIYCSSLESIVIPNSVKSIGYYAFYGCSSLTSVVIPNSVTSVGQYAFYGCSSLTSVVIPNSVTSIGQYAFYGCSSLTIYCEATFEPSGWDYYWDYYSDNSSIRVYWGVKDE